MRTLIDYFGWDPDAISPVSWGAYRRYRYREKFFLWQTAVILIFDFVDVWAFRARTIRWLEVIYWNEPRIRLNHFAETRLLIGTSINWAIAPLAFRQAERMRSRKCSVWKLVLFALWRFTYMSMRCQRWQPHDIPSKTWAYEWFYIK